jgi:hypothetical protein
MQQNHRRSITGATIMDLPRSQGREMARNVTAHGFIIRFADDRPIIDGAIAENGAMVLTLCGAEVTGALLNE